MKLVLVFLAVAMVSMVVAARQEQQQDQQPACEVKTTNGKCCVLPFKYKGKTYNSCTKLGSHTTPWCSTTSIFKGGWGHCIAKKIICISKQGRGYCVTRGGSDQKDGVTRISRKDLATKALRAECLRWCEESKIKGKTGCQAIWNKWFDRDNGCYVHTKEVAGGNGEENNYCWKFKKCQSATLTTRAPTRPVCEVKTTNGKCCVLPFKYKGKTYDSCTYIGSHTTPWCSTTSIFKGGWGHCIAKKIICVSKQGRGYCVTRGGSDQKDGVTRISRKDLATKALRAECLRWCEESKIKGKTGCQAIWNKWFDRNNGCYVHTKEVEGGNGEENNYCWKFKKCQS